MKFAQVVPEVKTDRRRQFFAYKILQNLERKIFVGSLVQIPFQRRIILGVVIKIIYKSPIPIKQLKSIQNIVASRAFSKEILNYSFWLSRYYQCTLSEILFLFLPNISRKANLSNFRISLPKPVYHHKIHHINLVSYSQPLLTSFYARTISNIIKKGGSVLLLLPEIMIGSTYLENLKWLLSPTRIALWHSRLTIRQRSDLWQRIQEQEVKIIIGSRQAFWTLPSNLSLIILENFQNEAFKQEQSPRYNLLTLAMFLNKIAGVDLILSSTLPSVQIYKRIKEGKIAWQTLQIPKSKVEIHSSSGTLAQQLDYILHPILESKKSILIFYPRKGGGRIYSCSDCDYIYRCPRCNVPFVPSFTNKKIILFCHQCGRKVPSPSNCPKCKNVNLKMYGLGIQRIEEVLKKLFPKRPIIRIDSEKAKNPDYIPPAGSIIVATQKIFDYPFIQTDYTLALGTDTILNLPHFQAKEEAFSILWKLLEMTKERLIVTKRQENLLFAYLQNKNPTGFLDNELAERRKLNLPPYSHLIKLFIEHKREIICQKRTQDLYNWLKKRSAPPAGGRRIPAEIWGPAPAYLEKKRDKFRWQIILKTKTSPIKLYPMLLKIPDEWKIDVDPVSLM